MPRLRNPVSGTEDDFTEGQARVRRRKGWLDVDPDPPGSDRPSETVRFDTAAATAFLDAPADTTDRQE